MTLKKSNLWDTTALDEDLLPPPSVRSTAQVPVLMESPAPPAPHLVMAPPPATAPGPRKRTEPTHHIMVTLDAALVDAIRQRDWAQLTLAQIMEKVLRQHFDEVVARMNQPLPKPVGQAQWGVRLPVPVFDLLTQTRVDAGGAPQRAAVESTLRVALHRL